MPGAPGTWVCIGNDLGTPDNTDDWGKYDGGKTGGGNVGQPQKPVVPPKVVKPVADFAYSLKVGLCVEFEDRTLNNVTSYEWDFGDGKTSKLKNPFHVYASPGNYVVTLTVTNAAGSDTVSKGINVSSLGAAIDFTYAVDGKTVAFVDISTLNIAWWVWDFGDGNEAHQKNPTHKYSDNGTYTVKLTTNMGIVQKDITLVASVWEDAIWFNLGLHMSVIPPSTLQLEDVYSIEYADIQQYIHPVAGAGIRATFQGYGGIYIQADFGGWWATEAYITYDGMGVTIYYDGTTHNDPAGTLDGSLVKILINDTGHYEFWKGAVLLATSAGQATGYPGPASNLKVRGSLSAPVF